MYDGYQIFFGSATEAKKFFVDMGFHSPEQQSTPDFLTSLTSPKERHPREGWEDRVPRTAEEFYQRWKDSDVYKNLQKQLDEYDQKYPFGGEQLEQFYTSRRAQQSKHTRPKSPYTLSYGEQIKLCLLRGWWRLKADPSLTLSMLIGNTIMGFIVASMFYNLQPVSRATIPDARRFLI